MREVNAKQVTEVVKKACIESNLYLGEDVLAALDRGEKMEESPVGKEVFQSSKRMSVSPGKSRWPSARIPGWRWSSWSWDKKFTSPGEILTGPSMRGSGRDTRTVIFANPPVTHSPGSIRRQHPGHYPLIHGSRG